MFCRKLSRLVGSKDVVFRACTANNQQNIQQIREIGEDHQANGDDKRSRPGAHKTCPVLFLSRAIQDYVGLIGASLIVGLKLQQQVSHQSRQAVHPRSTLPAKLEIVDVGLLSHHGWISPFFLRASPELKTSKRFPQIVEAPSEEPFKSLPDKIREYKKDFERLTKDYVQDIRNKIGVALLTSNNGDEGIQYLKANEKSARTLYNLAVAYETGQHVSGSTKPDLAMAFEYYDRAARLKHKFATYNLALFYVYGKGPVSVDLEKGTALLEKAHKLGVKEAAVFVDFKKMLDKTKIEVPVPLTPTVDYSSNLKVPQMHTSSSAPNFTSSSWFSKSSSESSLDASFAQAFLSKESTSSEKPVHFAVCF